MEDLKNSVLPADLFFQLCEENVFVKIIKDNMREDYGCPGPILHEGLNENKINVCGYSITGGIRFAYNKKMVDEIDYIYDAMYYAEVLIPDDAQIFIDPKCFKANKVFIKEIKKIKDMEQWQDKEYCMKMIKKKGKFIKFAQNLTDEDYIKIYNEGDYAVRTIIEKLDNLPEELVIDIMKKTRYAVTYINDKYRTEKFWLEFVKKWETLTNVPLIKRTYEMYLLAITHEPHLLHSMPGKYKTKELYIKLLSIKKNFYLMKYVPNDMIDFDFCMEVIKLNPDFISEVPMEIINYDLWTEAIKGNGYLIEHVINDKDLCTDEFIEMALASNGLALQFIEDKTPKFCAIAFENTPFAIRFIPDPSDEMCDKALERDKTIFSLILEIRKNITKMPEEAILVYLEKHSEKIFDIQNPTEEMILTALKHGAWDLFKNMDVEWQTQKICEYIVRKRPCDLKYVAEKFQTEELCISVLKINGLQLEHVKNKTLKMCLVAINNSSYAIRYVPDEFITEELYLDLLKKSEHIFKQIKEPTYEMCHIAVSKAGYYLEHIPEHMITYKLCKIAVKDTGYALRHVPEEFRTDEILEIALANSPYILNNATYYKIDISDEKMGVFALRNLSLLKLIDHPSTELCLSIASKYPEKAKLLKCYNSDTWLHMCLIDPIILDDITNHIIQKECETYLRSMNII